MNFHQMQARHERTRKIVTWFIGIVAVLSIVSIGVAGYIAVEAVEVIKTEGLKSVIDTIWNGTGK